MHPRRTLALVTLIASLAAGFAPPAARADAPRDVLRAAAKASTAVRSFRGTLRSPGGRTATIEYAAPDRYRMHTEQADLVILGGTTYMKMGGQWMKMPADTTEAIASLRDPASLSGYIDRAKITDLGPATLNGRAMHRYGIVAEVNGSQVHSTLWIGPDSLPYRDDIYAKEGTVTVLYSAYNAPLTIAAPM